MERCGANELNLSLFRSGDDRSHCDRIIFMKRIVLAAICLFSTTIPLFAQASPPGGGGGNGAGGLGVRQVGIGFASAPETASGWFNVNSANMSKWRAAVAKVRAGTARGRILFVGDSTTMGAGAGTSGTANLNGAYPKSWPADLAKLMNSAIPTSYNSLWSGLSSASASGITYPNLDTRVTFGANWSLGAVSLFSYTTGAANNLAFTPPGQIDTVIVYMVQNGGTGTATFNVDGGASLGTITSAGVTSIVSYTATVTKGAHTINIVPNNNGSFFIQGIIAYDSTTPGVDFVQAGQYGATAANWNNNGSPWNPGAYFASAQPNLSIICLTINDSNLGIANLPTYITNMQTVITLALAQGGDVLLMVGPPSNTTQATDGTLDAYISALRSLAVSNNLPMLDLKARWVSYAVTNPLMPYFDNLHPGAVGYQDEALAVSEILSTP
jgi:lysophospholipase L1-like esterase